MPTDQKVGGSNPLAHGSGKQRKSLDFTALPLFLFCIVSVSKMYQIIHFDTFGGSTSGSTFAKKIKGTPFLECPHTHERYSIRRSREYVYISLLTTFCTAAYFAPRIAFRFSPVPNLPAMTAFASSVVPAVFT